MRRRRAVVVAWVHALDARMDMFVYYISLSTPGGVVVRAAAGGAVDGWMHNWQTLANTAVVVAININIIVYL